MGPYLSEPIRKKESECGANDHIRFGVSSMQGWRKAQEDTYLAEINLVNEQGIFGVFDGENIDSGVMIRFVEQSGDELVYKSGGGITSKSVAREEYEELIQKVYVPI